MRKMLDETPESFPRESSNLRQSSRNVKKSEYISKVFVEGKTQKNTNGRQTPRQVFQDYVKWRYAPCQYQYQMRPQEPQQEYTNRPWLPTKHKARAYHRQAPREASQDNVRGRYPRPQRAPQEHNKGPGVSHQGGRKVNIRGDEDKRVVCCTAWPVDVRDIFPCAENLASADFDVKCYVDVVSVDVI